MLYERWAKIAAERRDESALRDATSGKSWTFGELFQAGEKCPADSSVVYPQGTGIEFILTLLGAWRMGKPACPIEPGVTKLLNEGKTLNIQHSTSNDQSSSFAPTLNVECSQELPPACIHLKSTSATTGAARAVAFTASQLAADADNIVATMGLRPDWPNLGVISMTHSYGFSNLVLPLLLHGIPLILVPSPLPEVVRQAAAGQRALTLAAVPALWRAWHEAKSIPPNVRLAISAGAPLPLELERAVFENSGLKIHNFYGSSECGGIAYDASNEPRTDEACVGTAMCNVNLSVSDGGCLTVQSAAVGETYWPEQADTLGAGRFQTSDLAEIKDGLVFLRGRASDIINVAGRKVSPLTIEHALARHPRLSACLVFSVPDSDAGRADQIVACVVAREPVTGEELKLFLSGQLPAWQLPRDWWFVESLAANRLGKISRADWRRRYQERTVERRA